MVRATRKAGNASGKSTAVGGGAGPNTRQSQLNKGSAPKKRSTLPISNGRDQGTKSILPSIRYPGGGVGKARTRGNIKKSFLLSRGDAHLIKRIVVGVLAPGV